MLGQVASMPDGGEAYLHHDETTGSGNNGGSCGDRCRLGGKRPRLRHQPSKQQQRLAASTKNRMAKGLERGGIPGWGSYLTFSWVGPFLKLGSMVTLKEEHLEEIYKHHER